MATGGVASAASIYLDPTYDDEIYISPPETLDTLPAGATATKPVGTAKTLSVTGGNWSGWDIRGSYSASAAPLDGYTLTLSGVENVNDVFGAQAVSGADTGGASFRGEIGATMKPGENSPWNIDLNVAGFAGKKQGVSGGISVAFTF